MAVQFTPQWQPPKPIAAPQPYQGQIPSANFTYMPQNNTMATSNHNGTYYPTPPEYLNLTHTVPQWEPSQSGNAAWNNNGANSTNPSANGQTINGYGPNGNVQGNGQYVPGNNALVSPMQYNPQTIRQYGGPNNTPINNQQPGGNGYALPPGTMTQTQSQQISPAPWQTNSTWNGNNGFVSTTTGPNYLDPSQWQQQPVAPVQKVDGNPQAGGASGLTLNLGEAVGTSNVQAGQPQFSASLMAKANGPKGLRLNTLA